jgi:DNA invertase Pin-like site-specific DNA recombinase
MSLESWTRATTPHDGVSVPQAKRAIIYCRVSASGQKDNGSLEEQEARCRAWCDEHGYIVLAAHHEVYSGEDVYRPKLDLIRDQVRAGEVDVIVADKVDRFSRADPAITAYVMVEAQQYGCTVEFVEIQDDSFEGQILAAVLFIVARVELKRIKDRLNAGKRRRILGDPQKAKAPRLMPGNMPRYGWRYRDETKAAYDIEPHQASIMQRIYTELGELGYSINAICRDLEAEHEPPPAEAQARLGHRLGKRRVRMEWNAGSLARMLKEPCYWGEPVANRYESFQRESRDPQTNRIRRQKRSRWRSLDSEAIIHYSTDIWPPIVSKELAQKALARLQQNQEQAERNLKHIGLSFLRAGYIRCGYCSASMVMHSSSEGKDYPNVMRFICGHRRSFRSGRNVKPCPAEGQFGIRITIVEDAVWAYLIRALSDPKIVPTAYERLATQEHTIEQSRQSRLRVLDTLIREATVRYENFKVAVGETSDSDVRKGLLELASKENASIRTWRTERQAIEQDTQAQRSEIDSIRSSLARINSNVVQMLRASIVEKRKLVQALGIRVFVYRMEHEPWFELASDLQGLVMSWQMQRRRHATPLAIEDAEPRVSDLVTSYAVQKWTAPVPTRPSTADEIPEPERVGV